MQFGLRGGTTMLNLISRLLRKPEAISIQSAYNVRADHFIIVRDALAGDYAFTRMGTCKGKDFICVRFNSKSYVAIITTHASPVGKFLVVAAVYELEPANVDHYVHQLKELEAMSSD
jgi:hypothetical protein